MPAGNTLNVDIKVGKFEIQVFFSLNPVACYAIFPRIIIVLLVYVIMAYLRASNSFLVLIFQNKHAAVLVVHSRRKLALLVS